LTLVHAMIVGGSHIDHADVLRAGVLDAERTAPSSSGGERHVGSSEGRPRRLRFVAQTELVTDVVVEVGHPQGILPTLSTSSRLEDRCASRSSSSVGSRDRIRSSRPTGRARATGRPRLARHRAGGPTLAFVLDARLSLAGRQ
jgi:hypothetical protein